MKKLAELFRRKLEKDPVLKKYKIDLSKDYIHHRKESFIRSISEFFEKYLDKAIKQTKDLLDFADKQNAKQIVFFGRDSLPFYLIAKKLNRDKVKYVDFSRGMVRYFLKLPEDQLEYKLRQLFKYYKINFDDLDRTVFVDNGFIGSINSNVLYLLHLIGKKSKLKYPSVIYSGFDDNISIDKRQILGKKRYITNNNIIVLEPLSSKHKKENISAPGIFVELLPKTYHTINEQNMNLEEKHKVKRVKKLPFEGRGISYLDVLEWVLAKIFILHLDKELDKRLK